MKFEAFYIDYGLSLFVTSLVAAVTAGLIVMPGDDLEQGGRTFTDDFSGVPAGRWFAALAGGLIFNVANLCLCKGIDMLGLALAFPLCIGTALVGGTVVNYLIAKSGSPVFLFSGCFVAFLGVCATAYLNLVKEKQLAAKKVVNNAEENLTTNEQKYEPSAARKYTVCIVGGILMSFWSPFVTIATKKDSGCDCFEPALTPFTEFIMFTLATMVSNLVLIPAIIMYPLEGGGAKRTVRDVLVEYKQAPIGAHVFSWIGGFVWSLGTQSNAVAGASGKIDAATAYAIGQCAAVVSIFWGLFVWGEFKGTDGTVYGLIGLVIALFAGAIVLMTLGQ